MGRVFRLILILVVLGALAGASLGFRLAQPITAEIVLGNMGQTIEVTQDFHGHFSARAEAQGLGIPMELEGEIWAKKPAKLRVEVQRAPLPELVGMMAIADGQNFCLYLPSQKSGVAGDLKSLAQSLLEASYGTASAAPKPAEKLELGDIFRLEGREAVAGYRAYRLRIIPSEIADAPELGQVAAAFWVEDRTWVPIQVEVEALGSPGGSFRGTLVDFQLDRGLADTQFACQFPPGTKMVKLESLLPSLVEKALPAPRLR